VWNPTGVDEALMKRMRSLFTEEQIVELGYKRRDHTRPAALARDARGH
jgi:hypothetical protein